MDIPAFLKKTIEEPLETVDADTSPSLIEEKAHKTMFSLIPAGPLRKVAEVFTFGAEKYSPFGWRGADLEIYYNAAQRHLNDYLVSLQVGEDTPHDVESNRSVLAHAVASLLILMALEEDREM